MAKIMIFGSSSIASIDANTQAYIQGFMQQGHEFLITGVSDVDRSIALNLSRVGAFSNTTVHLLDGRGENKMGFNEKRFKTEYDTEKKEATIRNSETSEVIDIISGVDSIEVLKEKPAYYMAIKKYLAKECDAAVCIWDGKSKTEDSIITRLNVLGKSCFINIIAV